MAYNVVQPNPDLWTRENLAWAAGFLDGEGLSQQDVANVLEISQSYVSNLYTGKRGLGELLSQKL